MIGWFLHLVILNNLETVFEILLASVAAVGFLAWQRGLLRDYLVGIGLWVLGFAAVINWAFQVDLIELDVPGSSKPPPPCPADMDVDEHGFRVLPEGMDSCVDEEGTVFAVFWACTEGSTDPECSCNQNPDLPWC